MPGLESPRPVVLELSGELDIIVAAPLIAALSATVSREPVIVVDLDPRRPAGSGGTPLLGYEVDGVTHRACPSHPNRWNCALLLSNAARIPFATGGPSGARTENATADHPGQNGPGQQNGIASDVRINTLHFFLARTGTDTDGLVMRRSGVRVPKAAHSLTSTYV